MCGQNPEWVKSIKLFHFKVTFKMNSLLRNHITFVPCIQKLEIYKARKGIKGKRKKNVNFRIHT